MSKKFIEGVHPPELRGELPEFVTGVPTIKANRKDGTITGLFAVDGYYVVKKGTHPIRMIREYDVKTVEEASKKAREDGLVHGLLIEQYLSESIPCNFGEDMILPGKVPQLKEIPKKWGFKLK